MGFLSKDNVERIMHEDHQREMEKWAKKYPFAAYMMCSNDSPEQKLKYAEERFMSND